MATSSETVVSSSAWTEVVSGSSDFVLQNIGSSVISLWWGATAPTGSEIGFRVYPGDGVDSGTFLTGPVFAKAVKDPGLVVVNE